MWLPSGDHGGGSEEEVTSAMFVHSHRPFIQNVVQDEEIRQVDLVPTLSSILGVPIPFSNLGKVVISALPSFATEPDLANNWEFVLTALWTNIKQIMLYIQEYAKTKEQFPAEKLVEIKSDFQTLRIQVESIGNEEELLMFINGSSVFANRVRQMCEMIWAQFDSYAMSRGLVLHFLLLAFTFIITEGFPIQYLDSIVDSIYVQLAYGSVILSLVVLGILKYLDILFDIEQLCYFCVCTFSVICLAAIIITDWSVISSNWYDLSKTSKPTNVFCRLITLFSVVCLFSNSYIINESFTCLFLVISLVFVSLLEVKGEVPKKAGKAFDMINSLKSMLFSLRGKVFMLLFVLFLLLRFSIMYIKCRVEQNCSVEKPLLTESSRCLTTVVLIAIFITVTRLYLRSAGNLVGFSPTVFVSRYAPTAIVISTSGFWILQSLPRKTQYKLFEPWQLQMLPRTATCVLLIGFTILFIRPLSVYHLSRQSSSQIPFDNIIPALFNQLKDVMLRRTGSDVKGYPVVFGLATAYSATFINFSVFLTLFAGLLLDSDQALAAVILTLSLWLVATIVSISRHSKGTVKYSPISLCIYKINVVKQMYS